MKTSKKGTKKKTKEVTWKRGKGRKAAVASDTNEVLKADAPDHGTGKTSRKPKKAAREPKPKRVSALSAAARVLSAANKPMRAQELIAAMAEQGLWTSPGGKTPHATLYAAMMREEREKGSAARFKKVDRGQFEFAGK